MAIGALSTISATPQYRIIANNIHSYFLVSHLSSVRRGRESSAVVLFPIHFAIVNLVQRLRDESDQELTLSVFRAFESLLSNVFVVK